MEISETVVAAVIGAVATVSTALFQLFTALRSRNKLDIRPRKGMTMRSILAVIALMVASGVGGFIYAGLRQQSAADDLRVMREELNAKLQILATTTERLAARTEPPVVALPTQTSQIEEVRDAEATIFAPACLASDCTEETTQPLALCSVIPSVAQTRHFGLSIRSIDGDAIEAEMDRDVGGARFSSPIEYPHGERKAVCVNFFHWSAEPHIATLKVQYGPAAGPASDAAIVTQPALPGAHAMSVSAPAKQ